MAGALEPGYSPLDDQISALGSGTATHPWIVNAGIVVLGAGFACLVAALVLARRRPWSLPSATLFAGCAVLTVATGVLPLDCWGAGCTAAERSWHHEAHSWATTPIPPLLLATPFLVAFTDRKLARLAAASGVVGTVLWLLTEVGNGPAGLQQRLGLAFIHYWVTAIALILIAETKTAPHPKAGGRPEGRSPS